MSNLNITVSSAVKTYGSVTALDGVSLTIEDGEFLTLLGPSGSGKTTLLMAIAGFCDLDSGQVRVGEEDFTHRLPEKRGFGMVFQGYALFPSMSVARNIAFPLKVRGWDRSDIDARVKECLDLVQMAPYADRMPKQLSGGQQQRVALARALSFKPSVLLLDEPLSALDKKLRADLQWELKDLHDKLGVTFIYVTHDQDEALSMSDRIVILKDGQIQQQGDPDVLYQRPETTFVADFLGKSNFIDVETSAVISSNGKIVCTCRGERFEVSATDQTVQGTHNRIAIRPERIRIGAPGSEPFAGTIQKTSYLGGTTQVIVQHSGFGDMFVSVPTHASSVDLTAGTEVSFGWDSDACVFVSTEN